jgi:hypothetical protein
MIRAYSLVDSDCSVFFPDPQCRCVWRDLTELRRARYAKAADTSRDWVRGIGDLICLAHPHA